MAGRTPRTLDAPRQRTTDLVGTVGLVFVTNHVLAGAILGRALRRRPGVAFAVGVASHVLMDMCPHWGIDYGRPNGHERFLRFAYCDGCAGLAAMAAGAALAGPDARNGVVAAMAGAALLDLNKPFLEYLGFSPFPAVVERFHVAIQQGREAESRLTAELIAGALLAITARSALRRPSRPSAQPAARQPPTTSGATPTHG